MEFIFSRKSKEHDFATHAVQERLQTNDIMLNEELLLYVCNCICR